MALPPSVRIFNGDFILTLDELRQAEGEVIVALEFDPPEHHKRTLIELLVTTRDLISHQTN